MSAADPNLESNARGGEVRADRWLLLVAILLIGGYLRFTGLNWDQGQWIHPDEGHMRFITSVIAVPSDLSRYFDTANSSLNPRNHGHQYSYGTLPLFITRAVAEWLDEGCGPGQRGIRTAAGRLLLGPSSQPCAPGTFTVGASALVGRMLSALAEVGTLILIFLIGRRLYGELVGLLAAGLAALIAFSIQQAHFFTVDSTACFFMILTAYFSIRAGQSSATEGPAWTDFALAGVATGFATASKISAALAALFVALAGLWWLLRARDARPGRPVWAPVAAVAPRLLLAALLSLIAFRIAQPYAFQGPGILGMQPNPEWFERLSQIGAEQSGEIDYPSGRQWTNRAPILFPWYNMVVWGMGIPLGLAAWAGWTLVGIELLRGRREHMLLWVWATLLFVFQATRWVKAMRYFLPLYPLFAIFAAYLLVRLCRVTSRRLRYSGYAVTAIVLLGTAIWAGAFFSIYLRTNTRIAASRWIYEHVPAGVTVANEHWDWGLPLPIDGHAPFSGQYTGIEMQNYNEDTPEKREQFYTWLDQADYIFLASNRLYGSIPRLPERYPLTTEYYRALFAGDLGFELAADFTSYPAIGPLQFPDQENPFPLMPADYEHQRNPIEVRLPPAEESFSVYDHPRVLIFSKTPAYSQERVEAVLGGIDVTTAKQGQPPREATSELYLLAHDWRIYAALGLLGAAGWLLYRMRRNGELAAIGRRLSENA